MYSPEDLAIMSPRSLLVQAIASICPHVRASFDKCYAVCTQVMIPGLSCMRMYIFKWFQLTRRRRASCFPSLVAQNLDNNLQMHFDLCAGLDNPKP